MDKLLLTPQEAGVILSIGRTKIYELMEAGLLESVTIGRCRRIPAEALGPFAEALRQGQGQAEHLLGRMNVGRSWALPDGARVILSDAGAEDVRAPSEGVSHEHQSSPSR